MGSRSTPLGHKNCSHKYGNDAVCQPHSFLNNIGDNIQACNGKIARRISKLRAGEHACTCQEAEGRSSATSSSSDHRLEKPPARRLRLRSLSLVPRLTAPLFPPSRPSLPPYLCFSPHISIDEAHTIDYQKQKQEAMKIMGNMACPHLWKLNTNMQDFTSSLRLCLPTIVPRQQHGPSNFEL